MRTFDAVILKAKLEEFITESKKNIDSKIQKNKFIPSFNERTKRKYNY